jgi:hypothetical protein
MILLKYNDWRVQRTVVARVQKKLMTLTKTFTASYRQHLYKQVTIISLE